MQNNKIKTFIHFDLNIFGWSILSFTIILFNFINFIIKSILKLKITLIIISMIKILNFTTKKSFPFINPFFKFSSTADPYYILGV